MPLQRLTPERRRELTRTALVEAAAEVFARRGFDGASLEEIAEAAGFTRGAIYSNFGSKEDLMLAVVERYNQTLLDSFSNTLAKAKDTSKEEMTVSAAALWRDLIRRDPNLNALNLEFRVRALRDPEFRGRLLDLYQQNTARIASLIERESKTYGIKLAMDPMDLAEILNATTVGLSEMAGIDVEHSDRYDRLVEIFFGMMGKAIGESQT
ncbi:MAG: TetR/AcrR family transcriptional regulator [Actinobacteria bacterium]|nr:MAG: TetR/AcrR family transcriptional regulator [Actinomycetota bacterium]